MNLVWKLLRQHISIPQFAGFFFANLVGMIIILLGVQFYNDTQDIFNGEDSFMKADYFIINKKIGAVSTITGKTNSFSKVEIDDIKEQDFVEKIGAFTPSSFNVKSSFDIESLNFSTEMFFESVPDDFVDVASDEWTYKEGEADIPIILPRNYLDLYNFGYAQSRNMPKLSEGILGAIKLKVNIRGNGYDDDFNGKIVGFSSRLNTILVPEKFMMWANEKYAQSDAPKEPTRLIMEVNNPTDENITSYLQDNGYETDQDKLDASKTTFILRIIIGIVMSVGLVISILSFYILMLSVYLLVQKNSTKLENLLLIGYSPAKVSMPYQILTVGLNVVVLALAIGILIVVRGMYLEMFQSYFPDFEVPSMVPALTIGCILLFVVSILNIIAVRGKVMSIWNRKGTLE